MGGQQHIPCLLLAIVALTLTTAHPTTATPTTTTTTTTSTSTPTPQLLITIDGEERALFLTPTDTATPHIVAGGRGLSLHMGQRFYLATRPLPHSSANRSDLLQLNLFAKTLSLDVDLNNASCGCNAAFYLTSMPGPLPGQAHDHYCDANGVGGGWCPEIDLIEANSNALHTTMHHCSQPYGPTTCARGGKPAAVFGQGSSDFGRGSAFTIDGTRPFTASFTFLPASGQPDAPMQLTVELTQPSTGASTRRVLANVSDIGAPLAAGMAPIFSFWSASSMGWLDSPPCHHEDPAACPSSMTFSNITITSNPLPPSPTPPVHHHHHQQQQPPHQTTPIQCPSPPACPSPSTRPSAPAFPPPRVTPDPAPPTAEQQWMRTHWPGYLNGVSAGGLFVIEDWMFTRSRPPYANTTLHLAPGQSFSQHAWSQSLLSAADPPPSPATPPLHAYRTLDCHLRQYLNASALDALAEFGITSVRLPVGYWLFDDPQLYPADRWPVPPNATLGDLATYGVNPDGYITPGTQPLTDFIVELHNRNMQVILDMHAVAGCSSPEQSYAGIKCAPQAPNTWNGRAADGISRDQGPPTPTTRAAADPKTWLDMAQKIMLERVVPYVEYIDTLVPGTLLALEPINEPDITYADASADAVRCLTLDLGTQVLQCLRQRLPALRVVINNGASNYRTSAIAADYTSGRYPQLVPHRLITDLHHYYNWGGCTVDGDKALNVSCVCHTALPGQPNADRDWAAYQDAGLFAQGTNFSFIISEWSTGLMHAHSCNPGGGPTAAQAAGLWTAQKWNFLSLAARLGVGTMTGDFYWTARMGFNWNPDPAVCFGPTSTADYKTFSSWDWSLLRLVELGLAKPLSVLGWTPDALPAAEATACAGSFPVNC